MFSKCIIIFLIISSSSNALPFFCLSNNPDFGNCLGDDVKKLLPIMIKGVEIFRIPSVYPFSFDTLHVQLNEKLNFSYYSYGYPSNDLTIYSADFNTNQQTFDIKMNYSTQYLYGNYTLNGFVNNTSVLQTGLANFTYLNVDVDYTGYYNFKNEKKTNVQIENSSLKIIYKTHNEIFSQVENLYQLTNEENNLVKNELDNVYSGVMSAVEQVGNKYLSIVFSVFLSLEYTL